MELSVSSVFLCWMFTVTLRCDAILGSVFQFYIPPGEQNVTRSRELCTTLGYDGLAVVNSPESFRYAITLARAAGSRRLFIGLTFRPETGTIAWEDGSILTSDAPGYDRTMSQVRAANTTFYGKIRDFKTFDMGDGTWAQHVLCGNYQPQRAESHGSTLHGQSPTDVGSVLSVTQLKSYLQCAIFCGQDYRCRVAEFKVHTQTCTTLGPGSYTEFSEDAQSILFIRDGYS